MSNFIKIFTIIAFSIAAVQINAQNDRKISIQSTLKDITGKAIPDGPQTVTFKLYNSVTGGTVLWTEMAEVEVVGGIYSHKLGSVTPLNVSNFGSNVFLGVTVSGGQELAPRTELTYAPYAMAVGSLAGGLQSASFETNGNFNITSNTINLTGPNLSLSRQVSPAAGNINQNGSKRLSLHDDGRTELYSNSHVVLHTGNDIKFYTDGSGTVTQGRHLVTQDLDVPNGNLNVYNGNGGQRWIRLGDSDTGIRSTSEGVIQIMSNDYPVITAIPFNNGGQRNIGINMPNPIAPLHVGWAYGNNDPIGYNAESTDYTGFSYFNNADMHFHNGGSTYQALGGPNALSLEHVSALFEGSICSKKGIWSVTSFQYSDKRIKNIIGQSNSSQDLSLLNKIKITDYTMIDKLQDNSKYKKVIAQDILEIFPQAVSKLRSLVPNIFMPAANAKYENKIMTISLNKAHELKKGDHLDILTEESRLTHVEVIDILDDKTFAIKSEKELSKIFIYGKYVDDFLSVDYDALSMLNISATQELYKKIVALESENKALKSTTASLEDRVSKIEAMLSDYNTSTTNTNNTSGQK